MAILALRTQMWDPDQHAAWDEPFQVFFMPDSNVRELEKSGQPQSDTGTQRPSR